MAAMVDRYVTAKVAATVDRHVTAKMVATVDTCDSKDCCHG